MIWEEYPPHELPPAVFSAVVAVVCTHCQDRPPDLPHETCRVCSETADACTDCGRLIEGSTALCGVCRVRRAEAIQAEEDRRRQEQLIAAGARLALERQAGLDGPKRPWLTREEAWRIGVTAAVCWLPVVGVIVWMWIGFFYFLHGIIALDILRGLLVSLGLAA